MFRLRLNHNSVNSDDDDDDDDDDDVNNLKSFVDDRTTSSVEISSSVTRIAVSTASDIDSSVTQPADSVTRLADSDIDMSDYGWVMWHRLV